MFLRARIFSHQTYLYSGIRLDRQLVRSDRQVRSLNTLQ